MTSNVLDRTPPKADERLKYGELDLQFGDLWMPAVAAGSRVPVVVAIHGGWWKAAYGLEYFGFVCQALKAAGIACWSLEYRRRGDPGGGFPGTFQDVAAGFDHVARLAERYPLDLTRVVALGHSAGGHLAFWLAGRAHVAEDSPLHSPPAVALKGVVALAGAVDLRLTIDLSGWFTFAHDRDEVLGLMGGLPQALPERYRAGDPGELLPLVCPQWLVQGTEDDQIPPQLPQRWAERGRRAGEKVFVEIVPGADHFDVVDPESKAWPKVLGAVRKAVG